MIRHGQASFGQDNYDQLSLVGVRQAKIVARYLSKVGKSFDMEISWQIMNASITRFKYNDRGIALAGFNDIAHLELEHDKQLLTYR